MAVRLESANNEYLSLLSGLLDYRSAYTIMGHVYLVSLPSTGQAGTFFKLGTNNYANQDALQYYNPSGTTVLYGTSTDNSGGSAAMSVATWYHVAFVRSSSSSAVTYLNAVADQTFSNNVQFFSAPTRLFFNVWESNDSVGNQRIERARAWTRALSQAEVAAEMASENVVSTTNLWANWPLITHTDLTDHSGNGRHLTGNGTLSTEDGPTFGGGGGTVFVPQVLTVGGQGITQQRTGGARVLLI